MQTNLPWILSEWHAYSASSDPIKMDGVLFQDIYSIIDIMMKKKEVQAWTRNVKALYDHLSNYNNPHHVTVDQLPTKVIDVLYNAWRNEGYKGDIEFFTRLLFLYIEIIQFAELMGIDEEGNPNLDSESLIPSVLAVSSYLKYHDTSLLAHDPLMSIVYPGDLIRACPIVSYYQFLGLPIDLDWNEDEKIYKNIDAFGGAKEVPQEFTIVGGARFNEANQFLFGIHGKSKSDPMYYVNLDWANRSVQLKMRPPIPEFELLEEGDDEVSEEEPNPDDVIDLEGYYAGEYDVVLSWIDVGPYLKDWDEVTDIILPCAMIGQRHQIRLTIWKEIAEYDIAGVFSTIVDIPIPIGRKGPKDPMMAIARMNKGDPLYSVVAYREAMSDQQLLFLMDQHGLPINRTV